MTVPRPPRVTVNLVLVALLFVGALTACGADFDRRLTSDAVVGTWTAEDAAIVFRSDKTMTYTNFPLQQYAPDLYTGPQSGSGTWSVVGDGPLGKQHVAVTYAGYFEGELFPEWEGSRLKLYFWLGGPQFGARYYLSRHT